jgi:type IV secretion system protein VirB10
MAEKAPASPSALELRGAPLASARLSKKAALIAVITLAVILGVIIVNVSEEKPQKSDASEQGTAEKTFQPATNAAQTVSRDAEYVKPPKQPEPQSLFPEEIPNLPAAEPRRSEWPSDEPRSVTRPRSSEDDARLADTAIAKFSAGESSRAQPVAHTSATSDWAGSSSADDQRLGHDLSQRAASVSSLVDGEPADEPDLNRQERKLSFQQQARRSSYLDSKRRAPASPYELKTGTVIPGIMITEINSDLPGEILAQVSQNVYDTASGTHLLIPQGSRLFGRYDSQVAFGQERLMVNWERLIFPDASTLELDGMSGHDEGGKGGFGDRVNNHYARTFGFGLLTSAIAAGYQLSQPKQQNSFQLPSDQQVVAGAVGQQMAELGLEIARRNLRVQPTLEVRKGYRLNVMVNQDIRFPSSYADHE